MTIVPRQLRVEYPGAIDRVLSRGNRQQDIYRDDVDRQDFLKTLAEACQKTGFQVYAYCLIRHHFYLVVETTLTIRQIAKRRRMGSGKSRNNKRWLRRKIKPKES